ncbi:MAG: GlsB/YeaQ/YmgE family stress response membrane protein [Paludibacter sp.]|nr:GlsB/YeaQ/YmgE family stress response membrane protein [Paludibacter sp.]
MGQLIITLLIGAVCGWLGSKIFKGSSSGLLWNIIIGIIGGFLGGWLVGGVLGLGFKNVWVSAIVYGVIGAIILLWLWSLITKKK